MSVRLYPTNRARNRDGYEILMQMLTIAKDTGRGAIGQDLMAGARLSWAQYRDKSGFLIEHDLLRINDENRYVLTGEGKRALDIWGQFIQIILNEKRAIQS